MFTHFIARLHLTGQDSHTATDSDKPRNRMEFKKNSLKYTRREYTGSGLNTMEKSAQTFQRSRPQNGGEFRSKIGESTGPLFFSKKIQGPRRQRVRAYFPVGPIQKGIKNKKTKKKVSRYLSALCSRTGTANIPIPESWIRNLKQSDCVCELSPVSYQETTIPDLSSFKRWSALEEKSP